MRKNECKVKRFFLFILLRLIINFNISIEANVTLPIFENKEALMLEVVNMNNFDIVLDSLAALPIQEGSVCFYLFYKSSLYLWGLIFL